MSISVGPAGISKPVYSTSFTKPDITAAGASGAWTTANSPITIFTVTGAVLARVYGVVGAVALTSTGATGTLAVGITNSTQLFLPTTTVSAAGQFLIGGVWVDSTPTVLGKVLVATPLTFALVNSSIVLTIATNNMTAGAMTLYCDWIPVSANGNVVAVAP